MTTGAPPPDAAAFKIERYKYILQQLHAINENTYRFLTIYQALATALAGAAVAVFVGYRQWGVAAATARAGVIGLLVLLTLVAVFAVLLIVVGILSWLDYRREECALTDEAVGPGFRRPPQSRNFLRWYETYIVAFIVASVAVVWLLAAALLLPEMT